MHGPQGEYVSVSRLEEIYVGNSKLIHQMYIYGNSLRAYLVAVVVPYIGAPSLVMFQRMQQYQEHHIMVASYHGMITSPGRALKISPASRKCEHAMKDAIIGRCNSLWQYQSSQCLTGEAKS